MNTVTNKPAEADTQSASLYASRVRVYPAQVKGLVRTVKWAVLIACLALYYIVPWFRWNRGPGVPDQAILMDIAGARAYLFHIEIYPQEIYFLTGLLVLGAVGLFAATSLFGRIWCGFACPQTVWTDLFMWVERLIQGDRNARMRLDRGPWTTDRIVKKTATHAVWILISAATGGAWIAYFVDAPTLARTMFTGQASAATYLFFLLFTASTYLLAGWAREQVCTYMCPWPRFQAAMLDEQTYVVTYRAWRGEPRGSHKANATWDGHGDCINCMQCVNVCPTGIDIRDGIQLECIGCGLCIDACNNIMDKVGRPQGLIAFETLNNLTASEDATKAMSIGPDRVPTGDAVRHIPHWIRPRTALYAGLLTAVSVLMLIAFEMRSTQNMTIIRDRAPVFVQLADGGVRNNFTVKVENRTRTASTYTLVVTGLPQTEMSVIGLDADAAGKIHLPSQADHIETWRVLLSVPAGQVPPGTTSIQFHLQDADGHSVITQGSVFIGPTR